MRLVHEIGTATAPVTARALAGALGIDEAQLSRMLARLRREGVVARQADRADGRQAFLSLTPQGRALLEGFSAQSARRWPRWCRRPGARRWPARWRRRGR